MARTVVLGGGLGGLYAASKLRKMGHDVEVVEIAPEVGGLMRSYAYVDQNNAPVSFDVGTHFLLLTGDEEIDEELRSAIDENDWLWYEESLPDGHYYNGKLDNSSGCLDLSAHPECKNFLADFMTAPADGDQYITLADSWSRDFGEDMRKKVLDPICNKFTSLLPENLSKEAITVFAPYRLKLIDQPVSAKLKESPAIDRRLAFANRELGSSIITKAYPKNGQGIGAWVTGFYNKLAASGIKFHTGAIIRNVEWANKKITALTISKNGQEERLEFDVFVSTLAPAIIGRSLNLDIPAKPVAFRNLLLNHFIFDKPFKNKDLHWVTNFSPEMKSFRITLYNNIVDDGSNRYRVTVETPAIDSEIPGLGNTVLEELRSMQLIENDATPIFHKSELWPRAFPVLLPGWQQNLTEQATALRGQIDNLLSLENVFFQVNILKSIKQRIEAYNF